MRYFYAILLVMLLCSTGWAQAIQPIVLSDKTDKYLIGKQVELLEDKSHLLSFEAVRSEALRGKFVPSTQNIPSKGFTTADYWAHFYINIENASPQPWILEVGFTNYHLIELFVIDSLGNVSKKQVGDNIAGKDYREFPYFTYGMSLPLKGVKNEVYLHLVSGYGQQYFPLRIWSQPAFYKYSYHSNLLWGGYYGMLLIVLFYHISVFWLTRVRAYLYIIAYLSCFIGYESFRGVNLMYMLIEGNTAWMTIYGLPIALTIAFWFFILFYGHVLKLQQEFKWWWWFRMGLFLLLSLNIVFLPFTQAISINGVMAFTGIPFALSMLILSLWVWLRGRRYARFYAIGSTFYTLGAIMMMLQRAAILPTESLILQFGSSFGAIIELVCLTLGLADTLRDERSQKKQLEQDSEFASLKGELGERNRLARDLHDYLGSSLWGARTMLAHLETHPAAIFDPLALAEVKNIIDNLHKKVRLVAHNLVPEELEKTGLSAALQTYIASSNSSFQTSFGLYVADQADALPRIIKNELYHICFELVQNILRHAQAANANLRIDVDSLQVVLFVRDDGIGMTESHQAGAGLSNIKQRVELLKGTLKMGNLEEGGTWVKVIVPLLVS